MVMQSGCQARNLGTCWNPGCREHHSTRRDDKCVSFMTNLPKVKIFRKWPEAQLQRSLGAQLCIDPDASKPTNSIPTKWLIKSLDRILWTLWWVSCGQYGHAFVPQRTSCAHQRKSRNKKFHPRAVHRAASVISRRALKKAETMKFSGLNHGLCLVTNPGWVSSVRLNRLEGTSLRPAAFFGDTDLWMSVPSVVRALSSKHGYRIMERSETHRCWSSRDRKPWCQDVVMQGKSYCPVLWLSNQSTARKHAPFRFHRKLSWIHSRQLLILIDSWCRINSSTGTKCLMKPGVSADTQIWEWNWMVTWKMREKKPRFAQDVREETSDIFGENVQGVATQATR